VSQPFNQREEHPALGELDRDAGEFWMRNPWDQMEENLSSYERDRIFWNLGNGRWIDISHLTGADLDSDSRAVAVSDFNNDGMPDAIVRCAGGGPVHVFQNNWPKNHWLQISLRGVASNRLGLGAKLKLEAGSLTQWREMYPVNSFHSQLPSTVHFGLGSLQRVDRLTIRWPSGYEQTIEDLAVDQHLRIKEGSPVGERVDVLAVR
jgi:hypothetical protein